MKKYRHIKCTVDPTLALPVTGAGLVISLARPRTAGAQRPVRSISPGWEVSGQGVTSGHMKLEVAFLCEYSHMRAHVCTHMTLNIVQVLSSRLLCSRVILTVSPQAPLSRCLSSVIPRSSRDLLSGFELKGKVELRVCILHFSSRLLERHHISQVVRILAARKKQERLSLR